METMEMTDSKSRVFIGHKYEEGMPEFLPAEDDRPSLSVKVDVDVSEALTGLKALQREAKKAAQAMAELDGGKKPISTKSAYVVILVSTPKEADAINASLPYKSELTNVKVEAFSVGQSMCGIRFGGTRPTIVIKNYGELTSESDLKWERGCVLPLVTPNTVLI